MRCLVRSAAYVAACENKSAALIATAQALRRPFPEDFVFQPKAPLCDTVIFLRRTDETGRLVVMGGSMKSTRTGSIGSCVWRSISPNKP